MGCSDWPHPQTTRLLPTPTPHHSSNKFEISSLLHLLHPYKFMEMAPSPSTPQPASSISPFPPLISVLRSENQRLVSQSPISINAYQPTNSLRPYAGPLYHYPSLSRALISISFAFAVLPPASTAHLYSDNRQALKLGQQALATLAPAFSLLPCGSILTTVQSSQARPILHWIRSHPENHTPVPHWTTSQRGIHRADLLAKLSYKARHFLFPHDHLYHIDLATLHHIIPTGTWLWHSQGHPTFQSIGYTTTTDNT
jgi:hypothetical protein